MADQDWLDGIIAKLPVWCPVCRGGGKTVGQEDAVRCEGCGGSGTVEDWLQRRGATFGRKEGWRE